MNHTAPIIASREVLDLTRTLAIYNGLGVHVSHYRPRRTADNGQTDEGVVTPFKCQSQCISSSTCCCDLVGAQTNIERFSVNGDKETKDMGFDVVIVRCGGAICSTI